MRTWPRTDPGWIEVDALVALLVIALGAAALAGAAFAAAGAGERAAASAAATLGLEADHAGALADAASR